jgi:hypothetical protein
MIEFDPTEGPLPVATCEAVAHRTVDLAMALVALQVLPTR